MQFDLKNIDFKKIDFKDPGTQKTILIILVGINTLLIYMYFVFFPQVVNDINLTRNIIRTRGNLIAARSLIAEKGKLKDKAEEYDRKIELYEKKLPAQQEIPALLENLSKMAKNANITIIGITPAASKTAKEKKNQNQVYKEIPILIKAKSGYHELGRFLNNLENADRFMKVTDISIKANAALPKKHDVQLMVYTYALSGE